MGCTAFLKEVDPLTGAVNTTNVIHNLKLEAERSFFGYGIFETTAVLVAFLVALFALINDPTGWRHSPDVSELKVYRQWRRGMCLLILNVVFTVVVIVLDVKNCWTGSDVVWLLLLMFAPWAPLAKTVSRTVRAGPAVSSMMRSRVVSNTLAAALREGLRLGAPSLSRAAVARHIFGLPAAKSVRVHEDVVKICSRDIVQQIEAAFVPDVNLPFTLASWLDGPQVENWGRFYLWRLKMAGSYDPVMRFMSRGKFRFQDPFPTNGDSSLSENGDPSSSVWWRTLFSSSKPSLNQCLFNGRDLTLDTIDELQAGGTISDSRQRFLKTRSICPFCITATRAAVEAFLESSARNHVGVRSSEWFDGVLVESYGGVSACLQVMKRSCFSDNKGVSLDEKPNVCVSSYPTRHPCECGSSTSRLLLFLFLVSRSLLHDATSLRPVAEMMRMQLGPETVWKNFWEQMRIGLLEEFEHVAPKARKLPDLQVEKLMCDALSAAVDKHVVEPLIGKLCETLADTRYYHQNSLEHCVRLCDDESCLLHQPESFVIFSKTCV